jgi:hypothetical protein
MRARRIEGGVRFPDAVVLAECRAWPVLLIQVDGRSAWIHRDYLLDDGLKRPGDRGTLVLSRWAAEGYGLLRPERETPPPASWAVPQRAA